MPELLGIFDTIGPLLVVIVALVLVIILLRLLIRLLSRLFRGMPSSKKSIKGAVRQYTASTETLPKYNILNNNSSTLTIQVWRFVLERFDENGNPLPLIAVEMKGQTISGFIAEGHEIEIFDDVTPGHLVIASEIYNRTANTFITVKK